MFYTTHKIIKRVLALAVFVAALTSCTKTNPFAGLSSFSGYPAIAVRMNDGKSINSFGLYGTPSIILIFNTEDAYSRKALNLLQEVYYEYGRDVEFIPISREEGKASIAEYWEAKGLTLPYSAQASAEQADKVSSKLPAIIVADAKLSVKYRWEGGENLPNLTALRKALDKVVVK